MNIWESYMECRVKHGGDLTESNAVSASVRQGWKRGDNMGHTWEKRSMIGINECNGQLESIDDVSLSLEDGEKES